MLTFERAKQVAQACESIATRLKSVLKDVEQLLDTNSNLSIDWGNAQLPAYLVEDGNGNLSGLTYTRQEVSNLIGSFDQVRKLMRDQAPTQGDHLGNLNKLANVSA